MLMYFVRHAESEGNATGNYATEQSGVLSKRGMQQARDLASSLQTFSFNQIVVSPLSRALQTAVPYLQATGQRAVIWPELAEFGLIPQRAKVADSWSSRPFHDPIGLPDLFNFYEDKAIMPIEGEPEESARRRVEVVKERLLALPDELETILVITHGHFLRNLFLCMLGMDDIVSVSHINCAMSCIRSNKGGFCLEFSNRPMTCK